VGQRERASSGELNPTVAQDDSLERIQSAIRVIRGQKMMLDQELAGFYGVTTGRLNEQFRRNRDRFPADFVCQLAAQLLSPPASRQRRIGFRTERGRGE